MRRITLSTAMFALSMALLAGCGGGSEEDFQRDIVAARDRTDAALTQVTRAKSIDDLLKRLRIAATEVRAAATDVREADAPDGLAEEAKSLESALHELSDELVGTVNTFVDAPEAIASARGFNFEAWETVQTTLAELRRAGIDVAPLERQKAP